MPPSLSIINVVSLLPGAAPLAPSGPIISNLLRGLDAPIATSPAEFIVNLSPALVTSLTAKVPLLFLIAKSSLWFVSVKVICGIASSMFNSPVTSRAVVKVPFPAESIVNLSTPLVASRTVKTP